MSPAIEGAACMVALYSFTQSDVVTVIIVDIARRAIEVDAV